MSWATRIPAQETQDKCFLSARLLSMMSDVLVLRFTLLASAKYHGAERIKTRCVTRDWSNAATADHFQLCLRRPELIHWACHDMLNPMPALEDAVRELQGAMMPWLVKR